MGKIPNSAENPIDNWFHQIGEHLCPCFKKAGFTPNGITTLSLIFALLSIWFLWKGYVWIFVILFIISYFFDCMDGLYARKYNMTSQGGDWYDHIKDLVVGIAVIVVLWIKYKNKCGNKLWWTLMFLYAVILLLEMALVGCHARAYKGGDSAFLYKKLCPGDPHKNIKWLRYVAGGTTIVLALAGIVLIDKKLCKGK